MSASLRDTVLSLMPPRTANEKDWRRMIGTLAGAGSLLMLSSLLWRRYSRTKQVTITSLFVYPVKGCRGHSVQQAELTPLGLKHDRLYMIIDEKKHFVSQRQVQGLACIHPDMPTEAGITLRCAPECAADKTQPPLFVPRLAGRSTCTTQVWSDSVPAVDQGDAAAKWLQDVTGKQGVRLVYLATDAKRVTDSKFGVGITGFSDGFPVLFTSQESVNDLRRRVGSSVSFGVQRFRTNVHVAGCRAWEEDEIRSVTFQGSGTTTLSLVKPCSRCQVPTINQATADRTKGGEPIFSLRLFRSGCNLFKSATLHKTFFTDPSMKDEVFFGQNALPEFTPGATLRVGDVGDVSF
eukprot:TRINITY_DN22309_c0_g3_i1.p1 TRINITY_DN22309_c0_g3~~TRINITY_DN22309_c0_g3_i1.p1  ORF type:complete len:370 (+),score=22.79 TRINITY_DN22309_c0_g3_i1:62-1111(+)